MRTPFAALTVAVLALATLSLASQVIAAEGEASSKDGKPGTNVDMPFLMAPLTGADGKLSGYAYVSSRLTATSDAGANDAREKIAFIQDAFVRDVNKTEVVTSGDPVAVDTSALETRLLADARKVVGTTKIASIAIMQVQIAPLHPVPITPGAVPAPQQNESAVAAKPVKAP